MAYPYRAVLTEEQRAKLRGLVGSGVSPADAPRSRRARHDPGYARGGVVNLFLATEPLRGWRTVLVSDQRTRLDFARCVKDLVDAHYPGAEKIVLVLDQFTTHSPASLYAVFPTAEAQRLAEKLEVHHTPKHGSWLNMAELELAVLQRRCLNRRLGDRAELERGVAAWAAPRNAAAATIDWQFTTTAARTKLRRHYPVFDAPLVAGKRVSLSEADTHEGCPYKRYPGHVICHSPLLLPDHAIPSAACSPASANARSRSLISAVASMT
ncbi:MAG TPA: transposase [Thermomicrobiales bacterium]|nr:transposase [Thermomicrobiales bacterium]